MAMPIALHSRRLVPQRHAYSSLVQDRQGRFDFSAIPSCFKLLDTTIGSKRALVTCSEDSV